MARHYRAGLLRAALPSMARHYRLDDCALLIPGRSRRQAVGRAEPCSAAVGIGHCPLAGACRAWLGTTGGMIARCSSRDDRAGRPRVEPSHARLPLASIIAPLRGPAEHGSALQGGLLHAALPSMARHYRAGLLRAALPSMARHYRVDDCALLIPGRSRRQAAGRAEPCSAAVGIDHCPLAGACRAWLGTTGGMIERGPAEHGSALPGWIVARCLAEHGSALPVMQKSRLSPALLDYLPLTCLIRRRLRLIWRSVRTFFLPSYGFTPSRKMNCTGVPTSLKRLRKKFSR